MGRHAAPKALDADPGLGYAPRREMQYHRVPDAYGVMQPGMSSMPRWTEDAAVDLKGLRAYGGQPNLAKAPCELQPQCYEGAVDVKAVHINKGRAGPEHR